MRFVSKDIVRTTLAIVQTRSVTALVYAIWYPPAGSATIDGPESAAPSHRRLLRFSDIPSSTLATVSHASTADSSVS